MAITTAIKEWTNRGLARANCRLDTLTKENAELARLRALKEQGWFDRPAFPIPRSFEVCDVQQIAADLRDHRERFRDFTAPERNAVGYSFDNNFYRSPDAEILYCMVRRHAPKRIVEIGCGNSTKLSRLAIQDGRLATRLISIDPSPRAEIRSLSDEVHLLRAEDTAVAGLLASIEPGDLLFVDSSHEVRAGNDVVSLFLNVIPRLPAGVLLHIHDIFLPYEYPYDWVGEQRIELGEQYLVQLMLTGNPRIEVLWPGYYLQHTVPEFASWFEHIGAGRAQSLWLRTG
jgi:SAM-dependent methyltransferase